MQDFPDFETIEKNDVYEEKICDLFFDATRKRDQNELEKWGEKLRELLGTISDSNNSNENAKLLYKMIGYTRDICCGKGERDLTYMMIYIWYQYFPELAFHALHILVYGYDIHNIRHFKEGNIHSDAMIHAEEIVYKNIYSKYGYSNNDGNDCRGNDCRGNGDNHCRMNASAYGSWKDVKHFCGFIQERCGYDHPLIVFSMTLLNQKLYNDYVGFMEHDKLPSLACKWVPREKHAHGWIFNKMALQWMRVFSPKLAKKAKYSELAEKKCMMNYRKILSHLNALVDVTEVKQCAKKWSQIIPSKIPRETLARNMNAFLNMNNMMENRKDTEYDVDRRECSHLIREHFVKRFTPFTMNLFMNQKKEKSLIDRPILPFSPAIFVKRAIHLILLKNGDRNTGDTLGSDSDSLMCMQNILYQIDLLNKEWEDFLKKCDMMGDLVPCIDMSLSMQEGDGSPLYHAIGFGCLICEKSNIGRRILVIDHNPTWLNMENCFTFFDMISTIINNAEYGTVSNIDAGFHLLATSISNISKEDMKKRLVFVVFSNNVLEHNEILSLFLVDCPHVVYWNLHNKTFHIENNMNSERTTVFSGTNIHLLQHFRFIDAENIYKLGAYEAIQNMLVQNRYDIFGEVFDKYM